MKNDISQSRGLDLDNINVYAEVYQKIPLSSRDKAIFTLCFRFRTLVKWHEMPNDISTVVHIDSLQIDKTLASIPLRQINYDSMLEDAIKFRRATFVQ